MTQEQGATHALTLFAAQQEIKAVQIKLQARSEDYKTQPEQRVMLERAAQSARLASIALGEAISALNVEFDIDTRELAEASEAKEAARELVVT